MGVVVSGQGQGGSSVPLSYGQFYIIDQYNIKRAALKCLKVFRPDALL